MAKRNISKWIAEGEKLSEKYPRSTSIDSCDFYILVKDSDKLISALKLYYLGLSIGYKLGMKER